MHPVLASFLAQQAAGAPVMREGLRTKPAANSAGAALEKLGEAYEKRHKDLGLKTRDVALNAGHPYPDGFMGSYEKGTVDPRRLGAYDTIPNSQGDKVDRFHYNPNASAEILAHEMGHAVTAKTDIGSKLHNARINPKLGRALLIAGGVLPVGAAALTPGDDEYDEAMLGTLALASPTIINEALATKNGLAMMKDAGMPATMGQRGRLAGALLSYIAAPLVTASVGTAVGNQFDENV